MLPEIPKDYWQALFNVYGGTTLERGVFGNRRALPIEIARVISQAGFAELEPYFQPDGQDLCEKEEGLDK